MFRVFGCPLTTHFHQHVTFLRMRQLPFTVYCSTLSTTLLYQLYYRARSTIGTLTPSGVTALSLWQLAEVTELDECHHSITRHASSGDRSTPTATSLTTPTTASSPRVYHSLKPLPIMVERTTHPKLHLAMWCTVVYGCWWLSKTGAMYRWVLSEETDTIEGYMQYFLIPIPFIGKKPIARLLASRVREEMQNMTRAIGISKGSAVYIDEHFRQLCEVLDLHFRQQPIYLYLLGTPHPTLADVAVGAAFSSVFLTDNPPAQIITEKHPYLLAYVERVTGWRGGVFDSDRIVDLSSSAEDDLQHYPDVVPETLSSFFRLMVEVFPFIMSQCGAFSAYMSSDAIRTHKREPLDGVWEGCSGYLFPGLTSIKSLMLIDNNVLSVQARSQDLEVALVAAREVGDNTLVNFGRSNAAVVTTPPLTSHVGEAKAMEDGAHLTAPSESSLGNIGEEEDAGSLLTEIRGQRIQTGSPETVEVDNADFYRVLTRNAKMRYGAVMLSGHSRALDGTARGMQEGLVLGSPPVAEHLHVLQQMLAKVHCPHYTLTSICHRRRGLMTAAIPEYEVARVRANRATR